MINVQFLVTDEVTDIPEGSQVVMLNGTVPGWTIKPGDKHYDRHRLAGPPIQLDDIPDDIFGVNDGAVFTTTRLDADVCCAAAWAILLTMNTFEGLDSGLLDRAKFDLRAIAFECNYFGLPDEPQFKQMERFARNAVATLKLTEENLIKERGFSNDRTSWSRLQKVEFESFLFGRNTEWLIAASVGEAKWPGQSGEGSRYWHRFAEETQIIRNFCRLYKGVGILEIPSGIDDIDPRHLIQWVRHRDGHSNIALIARQRPLKLWRGCLEEPLILFDKTANHHEAYSLTVQGFEYTLQSVPLHELGSPKFSDGRELPVYDFDEDCINQPLNSPVWDVLSKNEQVKREWLGFPEPTTGWSGQNDVGGSGLHDASLLMPEEVIDYVLDWNEHKFATRAGI